MQARAEQGPAADTGERGSSVVGAALYRSPVRLRPGVRHKAKAKARQSACPCHHLNTVA